MRLGRPGGDPEPRSDLVVRASRCDQCDNLTLTRRDGCRLPLRGQFDHGHEPTPSFEGRPSVERCNAWCIPNAGSDEREQDRLKSERCRERRAPLRRRRGPRPAQELREEAHTQTASITNNVLVLTALRLRSQWASDPQGPISRLYVMGTWRRTLGATRSRISARLSPVQVIPWLRRPITAWAGSGSSATRSATATASSWVPHG